MREEQVNDTFNIGAAEFTTMKEDYQAVLDYAGHGKKVVGFPARRPSGACASWTGSGSRPFTSGLRDGLQGLLRLHREGPEAVGVRAQILEQGGPDPELPLVPG